MAGSYFVMYEGEWVHEGITLGTQCTLFQAEVISISHAASEILQTWNGNRRVFIYTHNLSVISAIQSIWQASELVSECRDNLNNLARTHQLTLSWIPAGFHGNEMAHQIASEAANIDFVGPLPTIPISLGSVHEAIDKWSQARHTLVWNRGIDCAMTKRILQLPSNAVVKLSMSISRKCLRAFVQLTTGHSGLQAHLHKMGFVESDECQFCHKEKEDSIHFISACDKFSRERLQIFGSTVVDSEDIIRASPARLLKFIRRTGRFGDLALH